MPTRLRLAPIVLLAACGRIGFGAELPPEEGCDWVAGVEPQAPDGLDGLNSEAVERAPFLTADGEALYFASDAGGTLDFYIAEADDSPELAVPERLDDLSSDEAADTSLSFAGDHQEVFFSTSRGAGDSFELYRARRPSLAAPFLGEEPVAGVSAGDGDLSPHLAQGDLDLYFASAPGGGPRDLYVTRRPTVDDGFGAPEVVAELSSESDDSSPALTRDGRTIVFSSSRGGSEDLYYATRPSTEEPFGEPVALTDLNTGGVDTDPFLTRDGCFLYFASDRRGGELDLFVARAFR